MQQYIFEKKAFSIKSLSLIFLSMVLIVSISYWLILAESGIPEEFYIPQKIKAHKEKQRVVGMGKITPGKQLFVSAPDNGQVVEIYVRQGQKITSGLPLIKIHNFELAREAKIASFELADTMSDVELKKSELGIMRYQLESSLSNAKTDLKRQLLSLEANQSLVDSGIVSKVKYSQELMSAKQAELEVASREKQLGLFEGSYVQQIRALDLKVTAGQEKKAFYEKRLESLTLFADTDSVVRNLNLQVGQTIKQGQNLVELIEAENLVAQVQIPQYSADSISVGDTSSIVTPNGNLVAKVEYVDSIIRNGSVSVYLNFEQALPSWIKIDQSVEAFIDTQREKLISSVEKPKSYEEYDSWVVYRVKGDNTIIKTEVAVVINGDDVLTLEPSIPIGETVFLLPKQYAEESSYSYREPLL